MPSSISTSAGISYASLLALRLLPPSSTSLSLRLFSFALMLHLCCPMTADPSYREARPCLLGQFLTGSPPISAALGNAAQTAHACRAMQIGKTAFPVIASHSSARGCCITRVSNPNSMALTVDPGIPAGAGRAPKPRRLPFCRSASKGTRLSFRASSPAGVAELVDALDLGTSIARCGGSSPFARTSSALRRSRTKSQTRDFEKADLIMQIVETANEGLKRAYHGDHSRPRTSTRGSMAK